MKVKTADIQLYRKEYYQKNKDVLQAYHYEYYQINKDRLLEYQNNYYDTHKDERAIYYKKTYQRRERQKKQKHCFVYDPDKPVDPNPFSIK